MDELPTRFLIRPSKAGHVQKGPVLQEVVEVETNAQGSSGAYYGEEGEEEYVRTEEDKGNIEYVQANVQANVLEQVE